jgi:GTPase involved in cell partitioning and DNA repair
MTIEKMQAENLVVVFNKADEDEDDQKSVLEFYAEALKQAKCKNLPKVETLKQENILILYKQNIGKKT